MRQSSDARDAPARGQVTPIPSADRPRASTCRRLRGKDPAPARSVKLVRHATWDGHDVLRCVLPRGRVHLIASREDLLTTSYDYRLPQMTGAITLVTSSKSSQYGARTDHVRHEHPHRPLVQDRQQAQQRPAAKVARARPPKQRSSIPPDRPPLRWTTARATRSSPASQPTDGCRELDRGPSDQVPAASLRLSGRR